MTSCIHKHYSCETIRMPHIVIMDNLYHQIINFPFLYLLYFIRFNFYKYYAGSHTSLFSTHYIMLSLEMK